jgi:hypothetical protein
MNYEEAQKIAWEHNLGNIDWQEKIALNTGNKFEVGYVYVNGMRELFCKCQSYSNSFYLCNEYRKLNGTE